MSYKMSGFSGFGNSPLRQNGDEKKQECYIDDSGKKVCPFVPMQDLAPKKPEKKKKSSKKKETNINPQ